MEDWYSYGVFRYTKEQCLWVLANLESFEKDEWPPMPPIFMTDEYSKEDKKWHKVKKAKSTYIDAPISRRQIRPGAGFENPAGIIAEINWRLEHTGKNGLHTDAKLLLAEVKADYIYFSDEAWSALNYISGWDRKEMSYRDWVKQRRYRGK